MFDWLKKKSDAAPAETEKRKSGFFSTDNFYRDRSMTSAQLREHAEKRVFQKTNDDLIVKNAAGIAMDSADQNLKQRFNTSFPQSIPDAQILWYAGHSFIGFNLCATLAQHWLVNKACETPARDAVRTGFEVSVDDGQEVDPEVLSDLKKLDKKFNLKKNLVEFEKMKRVFGIRIAMFLVDGIDYALPFNIDGVKPGAYRGISQIDPFWITPQLDMVAVSDPTAKDFYEPTWWYVNGQMIHKSHLIIARGSEVADILKPTYQFAGVSIPQKIFERVYAAERTANEAPMLAMTKRLNVQKIDVSNAMANQEKFEQKIVYQQELRDNHGTLFIDHDDEATQLDTSLTELDEVIMTQYQIVAAAANVPATKLLGTSPKGFNATGSYEESNYHEELESIQEHDLTPLIDRHHLLAIKSEIVPKYKIKPFNTTVAWKPTDSMTAKEQAELNKLKADTDATLANIGGIDGFDVRDRLINDPDSGYVSLPDREIDEGEPEVENA